MGFNEKVHAYIAAKYYVHLTETFGERGRLAFVHGTQYYAMQRDVYKRQPDGQGVRGLRAQRVQRQG